MDKKISMSIYIVVVILAVLGVVILLRGKPSPSEPQEPSVQLEASSEAKPTVSTEVPVDFSLLSDEELVLLSPNKDWTPSQLEQYNVAITRLAVEADRFGAFTITACTPSPLVIKVKRGSNLFVKNEGAQEISLFAEGETFVNAPANLKTNVKVQLKPGVYPYGCTGKDRVVGVLVVE